MTAPVVRRDPAVRAEVLRLYLDARGVGQCRAAAFGRVRDIYACMIASSVAAGVQPHAPVVAAFRVVTGIVDRWYRRGMGRVLLAGAQR